MEDRFWDTTTGWNSEEIDVVREKIEEWRGRLKSEVTKFPGETKNFFLQNGELSTYSNPILFSNSS